MSNPHTPTPEFRNFLETEVARSFRSQAPAPSSGTRTRHKIRRIATVCAAIAFGAIAGAAPTQVQESRQRERLAAEARAEMQLAAMRVDLARAQYEEARKKYELGVVGHATLAMAETELRETELALQRLRLNQEEMQATAAPPNDALTAPKVGSRDFVSDRMRLEAAMGQQRLRVLEENLREAERRSRVGVEGEMAELQARAELEMAKSQLATVASRIELRRKFLEEDLTRQQLELELQRLELLHEMNALRHMQNLAQERLTNLGKLQAAGLASEVDRKRAELEMLELQLQLQRLNNQLKVIDGGSL